MIAGNVIPLVPLISINDTLSVDEIVLRLHPRQPTRLSPLRGCDQRSLPARLGPQARAWWRAHAALQIDKLVYDESYPDIRDAIQRETNIKRWPRAWKTNLILSVNPTWRDLYEELNW